MGKQRKAGTGEWVVVSRPTRRSIGHGLFRDKSFQAISCTDTDNQKRRKHRKNAGWSQKVIPVLIVNVHRF